MQDQLSKREYFDPNQMSNLSKFAVYLDNDLWQCFISDICFRDQIIENQQQLELEKNSRGSIVDEHKKTLQTLRKETVS